MTTSTNITMKNMLESGVHYGHQAKRWNPKMSPYIFGQRNGIHIIDLQRTVKDFKKAYSFVEDTVAKGGHVLFVGTKRMAREIVAEEAKRSGMYYINHRWLGGTLTNLQTIRKSIRRLKKIDKMSTDGVIDKLTKKEALGIRKEEEKLERNLGGIKDMPGLPSVVFIVDAHKETIAVQEASKLNIPIVAVTDTNANPDEIDYVIAANDDSFKSICLFVKTIADACLSGKTKTKAFKKSDSKPDYAAGSFHDDQGHTVSVEKANTPKKSD